MSAVPSKTLVEEFRFEPLPPLAQPIHFPFPKIPNPLGPLQQMPGTWSGNGFNVIWRPFSQPGQDRFLELNLTRESLEFTAIAGPIPNRGLLQPDINMFGMHYLQQISDANVGGGLHVEPGLWCSVPSTSNPSETPSVVRMASIPHGTTVLAQGTGTVISGAPTIPDNNILPFPIGGGGFFNFPEQILANPTAFRSPAPQLAGITQTMVDNPNSVLQNAIKGQTITSTTILQVSSSVVPPVTGGGTENTSFLQGGSAGPNAQSARVTATFWIETLAGSPHLQLQYSQTVLLNFNGLSWPHVTVGTLTLMRGNVPPVQWLDPKIPPELLPKLPGNPGDPSVKT